MVNPTKPSTPATSNNSNANANANANSNANANANTNSNANNSAVKGNQITITNGKAGANRATTAPDAVTVTLDGKQISYDVSGFFAGGSYNMQSGNMARVGSGTSGNTSRFGFIKNQAGGEQALFSQGIATTNMPTTGTAVYNGRAAHISGGKVSLNQATFNVDYGKKTVAGTINAQGGDVKLSGTINGNAFSGTQAGISTNGHFYGNNAAELGGTYKNADGTVSGAYGAKK